MFYIILALVLSLLSNSSLQCQTLEENLASITANHLEALQSFENKIIDQVHLLSNEEREKLIEQLKSLKNQLCDRPGAGLITIPLMVTIAFGVKAFIDYQSTKPSDSFIVECFVDRKKATENFLFDLCGFIVGLGTTVLVNIEYRDSIKRLFRKEHMIEVKINNIINSLQIS